MSSSEESYTEKYDEESESVEEHKRERNQRLCTICFESPEECGDFVWYCCDCDLNYCRYCFEGMCRSDHRNAMPSIPRCCGCDYRLNMNTIKNILKNKDWQRWLEDWTVIQIKKSPYYIPFPGPN